VEPSVLVEFFHFPMSGSVVAASVFRMISLFFIFVFTYGKIMCVNCRVIHIDVNFIT
jgi:hypothetical protein